MTMPQRPTDRIAPLAWAWLGARAPRTILALGGIAIAAAAGPAAARDHATGDAGDWTVTVSKDGKGCFLTREYERNGGTTLLLGLDGDGANRLSVLNANWSIKPGQRMKLNFRLSNSSYPAHFAIGIVSEGKQGFATSFGAKFPSYFAASKTVEITRGQVPVERLDLAGGEAAVGKLRRCVDGQRDAPSRAVSDKARPDDIPVDPFVPVSSRKSKK